MINLADGKWWIPFFIVGFIPAFILVLFVTYFTDLDNLHWMKVLPSWSVFFGVFIIVGISIWIVF